MVATNTMIDFAFAISYFVCLVLLWIFGMNHLNAVWRLTLGLGAVPPLFLLYFRLKMKEVGLGSTDTMVANNEEHFSLRRMRKIQ